VISPRARPSMRAWYVALRHGCYAHRDTLDQDVKVEHRVMPVSEWGASWRGFRAGQAGS